MKVILIWKWLAEFLFTHLPWNKPPPITPFDVLLCVSNSHSVGTTHVSHRLLGITFGERLGAFKIGYATFFLSLTASSLFMHIHYKKKNKASVIQCSNLRWMTGRMKVEDIQEKVSMYVRNNENVKMFLSVKRHYPVTFFDKWRMRSCQGCKVCQKWLRWHWMSSRGQIRTPIQPWK